ncbi:DUF805 domain-containing protein [Pseudoalteromonas luteoviolacea]|uniref:Putative membrane protein n=1 Tax=Pseudoalteromonas luteoviolacea (strain 2ta16) TaxID=1353533 RepID=V4HBC1_PSEL2|nr:DUF805 domain-containing protein [Pseudoalteromonas luteoviolacea]ESP94786.1 putative membrane protein [Pseudoalteromonas luteoviolacea 2ta16]
MEWYISVLKNYVVFNGRARRKEYWMFVLFNLIFSVVIAVLDGVLGTSFLSLIYALAVLVPSVAVSIRRLHDTGRSGWWVLISLLPLIGAIVLLIFAVQEGDQDSNDYGPNPKGVDQALA